MDMAPNGRTETPEFWYMTTLRVSAPAYQHELTIFRAVAATEPGQKSDLLPKILASPTLQIRESDELHLIEWSLGLVPHPFNNSFCTGMPTSEILKLRRFRAGALPARA